MERKVKKQIVITEFEDDRFTVEVADKKSGILTYDEMLGVIASISLNNYARECHECWLK